MAVPLTVAVGVFSLLQVALFFFLIRKEIQTSSDDVLSKLSALVRNAHHYPDMSGADIVTEGGPAHHGAPVPVAVPALLDERIDARHDALCAASAAAGQPAEHCMGLDCAEGCDCGCEACARSLQLFGQAEREITGRDAGPVHAHIRVEVAPGASPSEWSVSFPVPEQTYILRVDAEELDGDLLRVEVIGQVGGNVWIDLPADPIAGGRRVPLPSSRVIVR